MRRLPDAKPDRHPGDGLQCSYNKRIATAVTFGYAVWQQEIAKRGRDRKRHEQRCTNTQNVGDADGREQTTFQAAQEEERQVNDNHQQCADDNRLPDFTRCLVDDA